MTARKSGFLGGNMVLGK
ncbi:hypothetical protein ACJDU8_00980 [Clostridium sp. WILCCON 0269]|uniref:Uncharacterized protein n=1 Tax=Candidatus Clostridium eludens TaxID=3381663 RepID=A0ABW8SG03_9CLOT